MQRSALIVLGVATTLLAAPDSAHAYCASPVIATEGISVAFPSLEVPVWVSTGDNSSVEILGLSQSEFARIVLEVIARHNEAVAVPKLYFAGFTDRPLKAEGVAYEVWEEGIVVHSFDCSLLSPASVDEQTGSFESEELCDADTNTKKACTRFWNFEDLVISVNLIPPMCEHSVYKSNWSLDGSTSDDVAEVLLHEFGHALGLRHSDILRQDCLAKGYLHGNDPGPNDGAMWSVTSGKLALHRHWRRDDLDGFAALYETYQPELELAYWTDTAYPGEPALTDDVQSLAGHPVVQTPALADAPSGAAQPVVLVDPSRRVQFARLAADGSVAEAPAAIDGGKFGRTWGRPELAVGSVGGPERVLVVWTANEQTTTIELDTRWALRDLDGGAWTLVDGFGLRTSRVGAGFDPDTGQWLIVTLTDLEAELGVSVLDFDGALLVQESLLGVAAYDVSSPICGHGRPGCALLFSGTNAGGPSLGRVDFGVGAGPASVVLEDALFFAGNEETFGALDLARANLGTLRAIAGLHHVEVDFELDGGIAPQNPPSTDLQDWPVTIGAIAGLHRLGTALTVRCGDGIVQADEECDDGNQAPNDGCDDQCMVELGGGTGGSGGSGETGTGGDLLGPNEGCACALEEPGRSGRHGWMGLVALLGVRRRAVRGVTARVNPRATVRQRPRG